MTRIYTVEVDPTASDTVFLGAAGDSALLRGVYRSTDFGSSWTHTLDSAHIYTIAVSEDSNAFVFAGGKPSSGSGGIIYKSTDNGQNWDSGTSFNQEVKAIAFDPTNYQKAYAATDSGAYKTTNGGSSWAAFEDDEDDDPYCDVFLSCAVSRADVDTVYFGGKFSVYRASAANSDWDEITSGMSPGESNAVAVLQPKIWVFNDHHTLHESTDGGDTWKTVWYEAEDNDLRKEIALDPDVRSGEYTLYATHHDSSSNSDKIAKSTDTGRTWELVYDPGNNGALAHCIVVDIDSPNNATIYATYNSAADSVVVKSTNSGQTWKKKTSGLPNGKDVYCLAIKPDSNILYVGLQDNGVYWSENAGDNWSWRGIIDDTVKALAIAPSAPTTIYAATPSRIYRSDTGGAGWSVCAPVPGRPVDLLVHPDVSAVVYATSLDDSGNGHVLVSLNNAHDWLDITEGLPDDWIVTQDGCYFADLQVDPSRSDSLFLGTTKGLYYLRTNLYYGTVSSGTVDWDGDWIFVPYDYTIGANATLNVSAGTQVYFSRHYSTKLVVEGEINVNGTAGSPVEFLPAPPEEGGSWGGIRLRPHSDGDFDYTKVQKSYRGIEADSCNSLDIDHCKFHRHSNIGVYIDIPPSGTSVSHCDFDSSDYAIKIIGGSPTIYGNDILDCDYGIHYSGTGSPVIRKNTIDFSTGTSYYGISTVTPTDMSTNSPVIDSCKVFGYSLYGIYVEQATSSAYVTAVTCSSNVNGIRLDSASPSMVCQVGSYNSFIYNDSLGLVMVGSSSPDMRYNKIKHNARRGIHVGGTSNPDLDPLDPGEGDGGRNSICYFDDADTNITTRPGWYYDLYNGTQNTIDAEGNYWGDPTDYWDGDDPYVHTSQNVDYDPMLDSDPLPGYDGSWRIGTGGSIPFVYHLGQNYPNPFNAVTRIPYSIASAGYVSLRIYNLGGRLVRTLVDSGVEAGEHLVTWDSRNDRGQRVCSGVYFYRLEAKEYSQNKKLILLK